MGVKDRHQISKSAQEIISSKPPKHSRKTEKGGSWISKISPFETRHNSLRRDQRVMEHTMKTMAMFGPINHLTAPHFMNQDVFRKSARSDTNSMDRDELTHCSPDGHREFSEREESEQERTRTSLLINALAPKRRPRAANPRPSIRGMGKFVGHQRRRQKPKRRSSAMQPQHTPTPSCLMAAHQRSIDIDTSPPPARTPGTIFYEDQRRHSASMAHQLRRNVSLMEEDELSCHQDLMTNQQLHSSQMGLFLIKETNVRTASAAADTVNAMSMSRATPIPNYLERYQQMEFDDPVDLYSPEAGNNHDEPQRNERNLSFDHEAMAQSFCD